MARLRGKLVQISEQEVDDYAELKKVLRKSYKINSRMTSFNYADPLPSSRCLNNRTMTYQRSFIDCVMWVCSIRLARMRNRYRV